jgi:hypothetical protein
MFMLITVSWALLPHVVRLADETERLFAWLGLALFVAAVMYLVYLAIEPFVRRSWPTMLVGWSRAMTVRMQDAVIGRDIVIGAVCGLALNLLDQLNRLMPRFLGWAEPIPAKPDVGVLEHTRYFLR